MARQQQTPQPDNSLDFSLDVLRERVVAQFDQVKALDTKANTLLTAATTLMGTALILQAVLLALPKHTSIQAYPAIQWMLILLITFYAITILSTVAGYWIRDLKRVPEPDRMLDYVSKPEVETKNVYIGTMVDAFNENKSIIRWKVWGLRIAAVTFLLEMGTLITLLVLQILT
jgi:hypothetical protein